MNYYIPPFSYADICKYTGTCFPVRVSDNFILNTRTPTIDELQNKALSEIAITCDSILPGTAYDLIGKSNSANWIINGGIVMKNNIINKEKYEQVSKSYERFITISIISFIAFGLLALLDPNFFPRILSFTAILVIIPGTICLLIDKKNWKGKFQC